MDGDDREELDQKPLADLRGSPTIANRHHGLPETGATAATRRVDPEASPGSLVGASCPERTSAARCSKYASARNAADGASTRASTASATGVCQAADGTGTPHHLQEAT